MDLLSPTSRQNQLLTPRQPDMRRQQLTSNQSQGGKTSFGTRSCTTHNRGADYTLSEPFRIEPAGTPELCAFQSTGIQMWKPDFLSTNKNR